MFSDLIIGLQWVEAHNLEARIKEERCAYLVQELTAKVLPFSKSSIIQCYRFFH